MIVNIHSGQIRGFHRNSNAVFLGIPYGAACDGEHRFKAPRPVDAWDGIRDCTQPGPITMQDQTDMTLLPDGAKAIMTEYANVFTGGIAVDQSMEKPSENCLVLNVVTPGPDHKKRPVLVYIHGGGYVSGTGYVTSAISDRLVSEEDLVLVTVNHRLGVFGTLYLGDFDAAYRESGILTQLDLLLALQWIQQNISAFGGDPDAVTLIGESGGSLKIHHLLAMPESKGLFARAIMMSAAIPPGAKGPQEGTRETLEVMKRLGITKADWRKLLTMPAAELLAAARGLELVLPETTPFLPTADGVRLPYCADGGFHVCSELRDIPVIIGASEEEVAANVLAPTLTWDGLREVLLKKANPLCGVLHHVTESNVDELITVFRDHCGDTKAPWQIMAHILSAGHFLGGGGYVAAMARARAGAPVWHYTTTYDTPLPGAGGLACAWHTADLPLAFRAVYHKEAENLSKAIAHSFAAFARTGNPSTESLEWPAFTAGKRTTMLFDTVSEAKDAPYDDIVKIMEQVC